LLTFIPKFTSVSLIAEGLNGKDSLSNIQSRASKFIFALLTVGILGVLLFGKLILAIFGQEYADNSYYTLAILTLGSIPYAFNVLYASTKRLNKENMPVIVVYAGIAIITLIVGCILMNYVGIIGISIGWVVGNGIVALGVVVKRWKQGMTYSSMAMVTTGR
jgi:O-antigen/teichoic acid export membrane protein